MEKALRALRVWFRALFQPKTFPITRKPRLRIELLEDRLAPAGDFRTVIGLDAVRAAYPERGAGYAVAILDTGIDYNHPDLGGGFGAGKRVVAGWDFVNNDADPMDDNGHGTHLAGIIGSSNATTPGIAPEVRFIDLKVLDASMNGNWTNIDNALQWVISHRSQYNIVAVNLSFGSGNYTANPYTLLENDFATLKSQGVFTAVAAGNRFFTYNSQPGLAYPAVSPNVVSVGATWAGDFGSATFSSGATDFTTGVDRVASLSQRSSALSLVAPGAWITSTWPGGRYQAMGGTSMATAVVAGSSVLLHQAFDLAGNSLLATQDNILQIMRSTGVSVIDGDNENDNVVNTGLTFKRVNLKAAMDAVGQTNSPPVFNAIANKTMATGQTITVPLVAMDPNGDPLTFTYKQIYLQAQAYQLDQQYGFIFNGSYYLNANGANEKWMQGNGGLWYCILPNGDLRRWAGSMTATLSPTGFIAALDPSYYADPSKLWNAAFASPPAVLSLTGNQLSIRVPGPWVGTFSVEVTASDGFHSVQRTFNVTVTQPNNPPVLAPIANRTMSHSLHELTVALSASDADGDPITFSAQALPPGSQTPAVTLSLQGNQLTIHPALSLVGTFTVQVGASDGKAADTKTFTVTVTNTGPTLGVIATQTMSATQNTLALTLPAADADGDPLVIQAVAQTPDAAAYQLDQQYGFRQSNAAYYQNLWGANEKWLISASNQWYAILPTGKVYRWAGSMANSLTAANQIAVLDPKFYTEPRLLWDAKPPVTPLLTFAYQGNQLTIQRPAGYTGIFFIDITISDGVLSAKRTFQLTLN